MGWILRVRLSGGRSIIVTISWDGCSGSRKQWPYFQVNSRDGRVSTWAGEELDVVLAANGQRTYATRKSGPHVCLAKKMESLRGSSHLSFPISFLQSSFCA